MPGRQEFDLEDLEQDIKNKGAAYQKRSVALIRLCRLFLEISDGRRDQVHALKRFRGYYRSYRVC